jgi:CRISPR-associated endonuclease/helicase Cas3
MKGAPTTFWGKLEKDDEGRVVAWHPLLAHCADVAACAEALLRRTLLRRRFATLAHAEDLTDADIARLCVLAALHDIGKFNLGFQRKGDPSPKETAGHVKEVLSLFFDREYGPARKLLTALPFTDLLNWSPEGGAVRLLVAAIGHHGKPVACDGRGLDPRLWEDTPSLRPFDGVAELTASVRRWFPEAFRGDGRALPSTPALQHAFAGLVMLADWLGSDRHERVFPFADTLDDRMAFARERAARAVEAIGLDPARSREWLSLRTLGFDAVSEFNPRDAQIKVMELPRDASGSLTVLESETGSGKTEAALVRFLHLFQSGLVDGMTFALPTRSAATQLHHRVKEALRLSFPDEARRPAVILAVPGYLQFDDNVGRRLPGFEVLWNDDPGEAARFRGWPAEQPKRYLAGAVVIGTIDQVLLSSLRVSHAHLRATALLRHLLVVDEVHASDTYMNRILEEVLRFHLSSGGHAFLMSATLGSFVRNRLEQAALQGRIMPSSALSFEEALTVPYPAVHHASRSGEQHTVAVQKPGRAKTVHTSIEELADDPLEVARRALDAARAGARVLILRNTVSDAIATQIVLESLVRPSDEPLLFVLHGERTLHHARFAKPDRELLDQAIERRFGKGASQDLGAIVVATQTVQQSLDLDADILWTDLAPMDVLLQRSGRVHRHAERDPHRPSRFDTPRVIVMVSNKPLGDHLMAGGGIRGGAHGVGTVYDDLLILEATRQRLLRNGVLRIPEENRELVEITTHPEALEALAHELGERWVSHFGHVNGKAFGQRGIARANLVDRTEPFGTYSFSVDGLEERIATRLGENDRRAVFEPAVAGPFGLAIKELQIPGWLARDVPSDPNLRPADITTSDGTLSFVFGSATFSYSRLGLRRSPES